MNASVLQQHNLPARILLFLWGCFCIVAAAIHLFFSDGGSHSVAGLATNATLIGIFAWAGATQLAWALMMILVTLRATYRRALIAVYVLVVMERSLIVFNAIVWKPPVPVLAQQPPEVFISLYTLPLLVLGLVLAKRYRK